MIGIAVVCATLGEQTRVGESLCQKIKSVLCDDIYSVFPLITDQEGVDKAKEKIENLHGLVIVVATGGTEQLIKNLCMGHHKPILFFCNPEYNSLASGLEAYGKLRFTKKIKLKYAERSDDFSAIRHFARLGRTLVSLDGLRIASFGAPSKWLLTSQNKSILGSFGLDYHEIPMARLLKVTSLVSKAQIQHQKNELTSKYDLSIFPDESLNDALKLYIAFKTIIQEDELSAMSVRCFDLLPHNVTACLPLALLNDEGFISGCEGDIQALITMLVGYYLTDTIPWMANPSRINKMENSLVLAHCTIGLRMLAKKSVQFRPHMESGLGISFSGNVMADRGVLLRIGGPELQKLQLSECTVLESEYSDPCLCNIQMKVELEESLSKWIRSTLGNHQVFIPDSTREIFDDFAFFNKLSVNSI